MRIRAALVTPVALALALAACNQQEAPADEVEKAVEEVVGSPERAEQQELGAYAPRDGCIDLKGADNFRQRLALAVEARDAEGVAALAAPDVKLDFGGGGGRAELLARLAAGDDALWAELEELMQLGCAANGQGGATIPWYFAQDIPADPYSGMIVTGNEVPLRESPDAVAVPLAELNWDAVELLDDFDPEAPYQRVRFDDMTGYVETDKLRSIIDYRITASSRNDKWRITSFVAGD